jgi:2-haloacid dehalogenase
MEKPKAIIFDLLTALLDSWTTWDTAAGSPSRGQTWRKRYLEITFGCGPYQSYESLVAQSAHETGMPPEAPASLIQAWDSLQPWPEVPNILSDLKSKGYKLAVITNCSKKLGHSAAGRCGVEFDVVLTAEEVGYVLL